MSVSYLRLQEGESAVIRPVRRLFSFFRHYKPIQAIVSIDVVMKRLDPFVVKGDLAYRRHAIYILDRNDGDSLKIYEFGNTILNELKKHMICLNSNNPTGKNGANFRISRCGRYTSTCYEVTMEEKNSLSEKDIDHIKDNIVPFSDIYKYTALSELQEMYDNIYEYDEMPVLSVDEFDKEL